MTCRALFVAGMLACGSFQVRAQVTPAPQAPPTPQTPAASQPQPPAPAPPAAQPAAQAATLVFGSDVGILIHPIKPDKAADFELVMNRLREALARSTNPVRQQQAAGWKILKASEPGPGGSVLYLFIADPVVKDADYTVSRVLAEAFPNEIDDLWTRLRDAYAAQMNRLSLQLVQPAQPAPAVKPAK